MLEQLGQPHDRVVLILDQFMPYPQGYVEGLELCAELRAGGWDGVIIIRSANDEPAAQAEYLVRTQNRRVNELTTRPPNYLAHMVFFHRRGAPTGPLERRPKEGRPA